MNSPSTTFGFLPDVYKILGTTFQKRTYEPCILWRFSYLYRNNLKQCKTTLALLSQIRFKTIQQQLHNVHTNNGSTNFACDNVLRNKFRKEIYDVEITIRYSRKRKLSIFIKLPPDLQLLQMFAGLPSLTWKKR